MDNVRKSLELAWKHKILWIFSLVLAAGLGNGGGGGGGSSEDDFNFQDVQDLQKNELMEGAVGDNIYENLPPGVQEEMLEQLPDGYLDFFESLPEEVLLEMYKDPENFEQILQDHYEAEEYQNDLGPAYSPGKTIQISDAKDFRSAVLGISDTTLKEPSIPSELSEIRPFIPHLLGIGTTFVLLILFMIAIGYITTAWAQASLIEGTYKGLADQEVDKIEISKYGLENLVPVVKYFLWLGLYMLVLIFLGIGLMIGAHFLEIPFLGMVGYLAFIVSLLVTMVLALSQPFAVRILLKDKLSPRDSISAGVKMLLGNLVKTIKLGCISMLIVTMATGVLVGTLGAVGFGSLFAQLGSEELSLIPVVVLPLVIVFGLVAFQVMRGFFKTYSEFAVTTLFKDIKGETEPTQQPPVLEGGNDGK